MGAHSSRTAVIGAGFCGLGVMAALQRHSIPFDGFEADDDVGGNWYHGVYETVHIVSSRKTTQFDDFPMPVDWPDFPSAAQMLEYLRSYADHHDLRRQIAFDTRVTAVEPAAEGRWTVRFEDREPREYGSVVIAHGHHHDRRWPDIPGEFAGELIHAKDYRRPDELRGKRVLVIGAGNTGCDIAVEAARFADAAHLSIRRGIWFLPKTVLGRPLVEWIRPSIPVWMQRLLLRGVVRFRFGRFEDLGLQRPAHRIFDRHPTINSQVPYFLRHGTLAAHPDVARFDGHTVHFVDGSSVQVDLVVCATGYHPSVRFLADGVLEYEHGIPRLVGFLVPGHANLYVFGMGQPRYGAGPLISAGAETLALAIETQPKLRRPLADIAMKLGDKPMNTMLADPHQVLRDARKAQRRIPRLPAIERIVFGDFLRRGA